MRFKNRKEAGKLLAEVLPDNVLENPLILALPRGGVPLGLIIADYHNVPFDVILAKKIGHPHYPEFAIGAIAEGGKPILNPSVKNDADWLKKRVGEIQAEIDRRRQLYGQVLTKEEIEGKDVLIVDDGIATGMTLFAAIEAVEKAGPKSINVGVPVIPPETYNLLKKKVNQIYYVYLPEVFAGSVGAYYDSFPQISDSSVQEMLKTRNII